MINFEIMTVRRCAPHSFYDKTNRRDARSTILTESVPQRLNRGGDPALVIDEIGARTGIAVIHDGGAPKQAAVFDTVADFGTCIHQDPHGLKNHCNCRNACNKTGAGNAPILRRTKS